MAWYDEAVFYHIYPLGMTGAPKENTYSEPVHRLNTLIPWISHIKEIGCNAIYIGPLFESVGIVKQPGPVKIAEEPKKTEPTKVEKEEKVEEVIIDLNKPYEEMTVEELQKAILGKKRKLTSRLTSHPG